MITDPREISAEELQRLNDKYRFFVDEEDTCKPHEVEALLDYIDYLREKLRELTHDDPTTD